MTDLETKILECVRRYNGVKAATVAAQLGVDKSAVNHYLYIPPLSELLYLEKDGYYWYIRDQYGSELNMLTLESELETVEQTALEEEQERVAMNYAALEKEKEAVRIIEPTISSRYEVGIDYEDIRDLQERKAWNKPAWNEIDNLDRYIGSPRLFVGHVNAHSGQDYYLMDSPMLTSRDLKTEHPVHMIHVDDKRYEHIVRMWRFPDDQKSIAYSRNITMENFKVRSVDVVLDRSKNLVSEITDTFLRNALIRNKTRYGMDSIIGTIQEKQNQIRQLPKNQSFIVQGCAGSGKTMVLLHRLRYMLYNREFGKYDYLYLVPSRQYVRFIDSVLAKFRIHRDNVFPMQDYYRYLADAGESDNPTGEASELVYSQEFLRYVYSEAFIRDCCFELIHDLETQSDALIGICDAWLSSLMSGTEQELSDSLEREKQKTLESVREILKPVLPSLKIKLKTFDDIRPVVARITEDCREAEKRTEKDVDADPDSVPGMPEFRNNPRLVALQKEIKAAETNVASASAFTVRMQQQRLDVLKKKCRTLCRDMLEEYRKNRRESAFASDHSNVFVYEGISLREMEQILSEIRKQTNVVKKRIDEIDRTLEKLHEKIADQYAPVITAINAFIENASATSEKLSKLQKTLNPITEDVLPLIRSGIELYGLVNAEGSEKMMKQLDNRCRLFKPRTDQNILTNLNRLLFLICKRKIRQEKNIHINDAYKYYWYLAVYCRYLTRGIDWPGSRYLFIDEAQDLSPSEINLIRRINTRLTEKESRSRAVPPVMNLFGDTCQMITWHGIKDWRDLDMDCELYVLDENFRNTNQIVEYCNTRFPFSMKKVGVDMEGVSVLKEFQPGRRRQKWQECVYIVKNEYARKDLTDLLMSMDLPAQRIYTVQEAKGLEFKSVAVFDREMTDEEAYVACTRALIKLYVIKTLPWKEKNHTSMILSGEETEGPEEEE